MLNTSNNRLYFRFLRLDAWRRLSIKKKNLRKQWDIFRTFILVSWILVRFIFLQFWLVNGRSRCLFAWFRLVLRQNRIHYTHIRSKDTNNFAIYAISDHFSHIRTSANQNKNRYIRRSLDKTFRKSLHFNVRLFIFNEIYILFVLNSTIVCASNRAKESSITFSRKATKWN